ncbi:MAG: GGDEF domain-containing protein [Candidatus Omnitrophica bacterium]|nr:GGDEF domain-containing protein [Candidatus Omnitrophota bacterium]
MGILAIYFVSKIVTSELATGWFLLQGASMLIPLGGFFGVCRLWESDLRTIQSRSEAVKRATEEIRLSEQESLREQDRLEREVNEIVGLFELAREFNECIDLNEIVQVLSKQVFNRIPFERGKLVFLDEEVFPSNADRNETIWQGQVSSADTEKMQELSLEREVIRELTKRQAVVRFDTPAEDKDGIFKNHAIRFPLWIFPLVVGGEVTAAFWVEGARQEDFDKFEIIASQLALHVKKVKLYSKVKELSIVDGLTQLFVRRHFLERFRDELVRSIKYRLTLVVLLLDIDHFKQYNDTYGHLVGDVALRQVAQTIREVIRRVDIAARYGGEEFALVLPETDLQGGLDAAERIRSRIAKRIFRAYDEETRLTVSIGLTVFHGTTGNLTEEVAADDLAAMLLKQADEALYRAKEEGRNHVVVYQQ